MPITFPCSTNSGPKIRSRSRSKYRGAVSQGNASRSWCAVHSAVGWAVTPKGRMRRRSWASNQKNIQGLKTHRRHHEKIDRHHAFHMVIEERPPSLGRWFPTPHHILGDRRFGDL